MINIILILIAEYIGDFLLQDREMALNKSKDIKVLLKHLRKIGAMLFIPLIFMLPIYNVLLFIGVYCLVHGIQDWFIWKGYGLIVYRRFKVNKSHNQTMERCEKFVLNKEYADDKVFYDVIGLDRLLHVITLVVLCGIFF